MESVVEGTTPKLQYDPGSFLPTVLLRIQTDRKEHLLASIYRILISNMNTLVAGEKVSSVKKKFIVAPTQPIINNSKPNYGRQEQ